ncbi:MAG: hypothetical protein F6K62_23765 [Sphaerospermopsis sp. SIO1G2]|nr:hypothetical protein [Sphaerospermopsis sp. SIO1G2]
MTTETTQTPDIYGRWATMSAETGNSRQMTANATQLAAHWRRCSLSSDFWAHYISLFIPPTVPQERLRRTDVESVLAYLLNELFENCAKFSSGDHQTVHYTSWLGDDELIFQVTNHILPEGQAPFVAKIKEMLDNDPHELYFQRLEENVELGLDSSGLGYLTLIKDFGVAFGFRFHTLGNGSTAVDVQAKVSLLEE